MALQYLSMIIWNAIRTMATTTTTGMPMPARSVSYAHHDAANDIYTRESWSRF